MDNVLELAARATSYLVVLQDALALVPVGPCPPLWLLPAAEVPALYRAIWDEPMLKKKALALIGSATGLPVAALPGGELAIPVRTTFYAHLLELLAFVQQHPQLFQPKLSPAVPPAPPQPQPFRAAGRPPVVRAAASPSPPTAPAALLGHVPHSLAPETWRQAFQQVLYQDPASRVALARALDYVPSLVYELIGAPGRVVHTPRLTRLKHWLKTQWRARWPTHNPPGTAPPVALAWTYYLQLTNEDLAAVLTASDLAVPFEVMLSQELDEIRARREAVHQAPPAPASSGPLCQADALELCALALSGGGIRSATFNLGLLQGLASAGWLPRFDYLSTVSGGGYLGSWLATWIEREGSLDKVTARLCPGASPRPQADEVWAIRWLRMYGNYLAPKAGAFATDTWTMVTTWLRNTLLNQLVIVLALAAVLALGSALLYGWFAWPAWYPDMPYGTWWVAGLGLLLLGPATWMASIGMRRFWHLPPSSGTTRPPGGSWGIQVAAIVGAYVASGFFYRAPYRDFWTSAGHLWPAAAVAAGCLLVVAWQGRYDRCFYRCPAGYEPTNKQRVKAVLLLFGVTVLAAAAGLALLVFAWKLLYTWHEAATTAAGLPATEIPQPVGLGWDCFRPQAQLYGAFILGVPLVLEAVVLAVITRMALLGRNFPDERREWWGRMGAVLHRAMVLWMLFASSPLLMRGLARLFAQLFGNHMEGLSAAMATGGWLALVGKAVQLAFSARTRATPGQQVATSWLDQVLSFAPYLFGLGLLVQVQGAVYWLLHYVSLPLLGSVGLVGRSFWLAVALVALAVALGCRVGVNEFSLHHFYRNRLVRAYLGASRPRFDRASSANPFTGFDRDDDMKLWKLRRTPLPSAAGGLTPVGTPPASPVYQGPYLIINATLNATSGADLAQQDRQAESFVFTPLYCGFDLARIRALNPARPITNYGYRPTERYGYAGQQGPGVGTAMAISGAAANPNEGYHSSPTTAFLLTLFNVRLGWWMGNPSHAKKWKESDPDLGLLYVFKDLIGRSTTSDQFVNLSDGGHFDNMGLYELVRRRCRYIVLGDGEADQLFTCEGLANAIRRCRVDFGVEISLDVSRITTRTVDDSTTPTARYSQAHYAVGTIRYPEDAPGQPTGRILYVKSSLTNDEPTDVREYAQYNSAFPHQSTGDQFFNEAQFESYRRLGLHIFNTLAHDNPLLAKPGASLADIFANFK